MLVGIDVAKAELVVATRPAGERWTVANDEAGVRALAARLTRETPALIVLEATGAYELLAAAGSRRPGCRWRSSTRVRCATSRGRPDNWRRPTGSTPTCWRCSPSGCAGCPPAA